MIKFTIFKSLFDVKTHRCIELKDFDAFEQVLYKLASESKRSKKDAELISPATYKPDTTRKNDNVVEWSGWCAVDVDDFIFEGDLHDHLVKVFHSYRFVCYSTASSTVDLPKFRLVFPVTKAVRNGDIKAFWY